MTQAAHEIKPHKLRKRVAHKVRHYFIPHPINNYRPHFLREKSVHTMILVAVLLFGVSLVSTYAVNVSGLASAIDSLTLVDLTNQARVSQGDGTLAVSPLLTQVAELKGQDMAANQYFAHTSPSGLSPWYWFGKVGYSFVYAGENLAIDFTQSEDVEQAWLNSPEHRANIMDPHFTEIGIAAVPGTYQGYGTIYVVQEFGMPAAPQAPTETTVNTSSQVMPVPKKTSSTIPIKASIKPKSSSTPAPAAVMGAATSTLQVVKQTTTANENFMEVHDTNAVALATPSTMSYTKVTPWYGRLITNPASIVQFALIIILAITVIAVALLVGIEVRYQHPKQVAYGLLLFGVVVALMFLNTGLYALPIR